jgi:hypothetical protein
MSSPNSVASDASEEDWQWIYSNEEDTEEDTHPPTSRPLRQRKRTAKRVIRGARAGDESYYLGDCVLLRAEGSSQYWVAIIQEFLVDDEGRKAALFVWFSNQKEVMNSTRKRTDALPVCSPSHVALVEEGRHANGKARTKSTYQHPPTSIASTLSTARLEWFRLNASTRCTQLGRSLGGRKTQGSSLFVAAAWTCAQRHIRTNLSGKIDILASRTLQLLLNS